METELKFLLTLRVTSEDTFAPTCEKVSLAGNECAVKNMW